MKEEKKKFNASNRSKETNCMGNVKNLISEGEDKEELRNERDDDWMRESELSWLEKYWLWKQQSASASTSTNYTNGVNEAHNSASSFSPQRTGSVIQRRTSIKRQRNHQSSSSRKPAAVGQITIPALVKEESLNKDQYGLRLTASHGLGIEWKVTNQLRVFVNSFYLIEGENGSKRIGPGQACGLIQVGDELMMVNEQKLKRIYQITHLTDLIHSLDHLAKVMPWL